MMHVLNDRIRNNFVKKFANFCTKMSGGMSFRTCYTKLNFDFPYVRFLSLRRDTFNIEHYQLIYVLDYRYIIIDYIIT